MIVIIMRCVRVSKLCIHPNCHPIIAPVKRILIYVADVSHCNPCSCRKSNSVLDASGKDQYMATLANLVGFLVNEKYGSKALPRVVHTSTSDRVRGSSQRPLANLSTEVHKSGTAHPASWHWREGCLRVNASRLAASITGNGAACLRDQC